MTEILLSLAVPVFFAFQGLPYGAVITGAACTAVIWFWFNRAALQASKRNAYGADTVPKLYMSFVTLLLVIAIGVVVLAVHSAIYFFVLWIRG